MTSLLFAALAGFGVHLMLTSRRPLDRRRSSKRSLTGLRAELRLLMDQAGLDQVSPSQFCLASALVGTGAAALTTLVFGPGLPTVLVGVSSAAIPAVSWRGARARRRRAARAAWPRLIEELRVLTGAAGRSIPQALLEVGLRGPEEMRPAFVAAQREWALTTDLERTVGVLKARLADPTADATCETLLVAAEVGGDIDSRLAALADDRRHDLGDRRDAEAKQSGARFARAFVILVPAGMALAGLSVGDGREAYQTPEGQLLVALGLLVMGACWWWSGRIMRLPEPERVFAR